MDKYANFNAKFFSAHPEIQWFGRKGLLELDESRVAEFQLTDRGHHQHYVGYDVKIISKTAGPITGHFFSFDQYLHRRTDTRRDYNGRFEVVDYCFNPGEKGWYIAEPAAEEIAAMTETMLQFVATYRLGYQKAASAKTAPKR